jgi:hypothetical protein
VTRRAQLGSAGGSINLPAGTAFWARAMGTHRVAGKTPRDDHQHDLQRNGRRLHFMVEGRGTLDIVNGGVVSRPKAKSVTHVSGTACHPCLRPLIPIPRRRSLASRRREILTALHWGSPRRFVAGDLAESARAPAPRRELARKRPSNTGQPASRRRNPFAAARATIHPSATPGTPCRQRRAGVAR